MKQINKEDMHKIAHFFEGWNETMIWSCLQGCMGAAYVEDIEHPKTAAILVCDFCFLAGEPSRELVEQLLDCTDEEWVLVVPKDDKWYQIIEEVYAGKYEKFMRYAIKKEKDVFDKEKLQGYIEALPHTFAIKQIDETLFNETRKEGWSRDLCSNFDNYNTYEKHALGYVVIHEAEMVCGASTYNFYKEGIEIEIATKESYRRRGLARACGARLILECLERGLYPSWDAANKASVALAEQLGYHFEREYVTYCIMK